MIDFTDVFRIFNVVLIVAYFVYMFSLKSWWATRPREERLILASHPIVLFVTAYSSIEGIMQDLSIGGRVFLYTPSLILCVIGLMTMNRKIRTIKKREEAKLQNGRKA